MFIKISDSTGKGLTRLIENAPQHFRTPDIFEDLVFDSVNPGGFSVASFKVHRPVTQYQADLQHRNWISIGDGALIFWEGYIDKVNRSIRPDVFDISCLGWSAQLNQLWTTEDITALVAGYKCSDFINDVILADPGINLIPGNIQTSDYSYPENTTFTFYPSKFYSECLTQLNAGNNWNWGVWEDKKFDFTPKKSLVDWYVYTDDCDSLTISPNPENLSNYIMVSFTQDGTNYEQRVVEDEPSQILYGVRKKQLDIPGEIDEDNGGGATAIAKVYLSEVKDLKVAAELTTSRIFDTNGSEHHLAEARAGDIVRLVPWMPTEESISKVVDDIATFEMKSAKYDHTRYELAITPTEFVPKVEIQISRIQATGY